MTERTGLLVQWAAAMLIAMLATVFSCAVMAESEPARFLNSTVAEPYMQAAGHCAIPFVESWCTKRQIDASFAGAPPIGSCDF